MKKCDLTFSEFLEKMILDPDFREKVFKRIEEKTKALHPQNGSGPGGPRNPGD